MTRTMRRWTALPAALFLLSTAAGTGVAQERKRGVSVVPVAGWYSPTKNLRRVPEEGGTDWTRLGGGPMAGVMAEAALPVRGVSVRGGAFYVHSDLTVRRYLGAESCSSGCDRAEYRSDPIAPGRIYVAVADVVVRVPRLGPVRPYVLVGAGVKRYDFAQAELTGGYAVDYARDVTQRTSHVGLGTDVAIGRHSLTLELSDYVGGFRTATEPARTGTAPGGLRQHDLSFTAGWRIGVR